MATNNKSNFRPDGNLDIQGNLTVRGNILGYGTTTFLNDTVTVNDADGYVINSDSDVDSSYLQLNSQTSNIRLTYNSANLTIGTTGVTNKIVLDANSNVEGTLTTNIDYRSTPNSTIYNSVILASEQDKIMVFNIEEKELLVSMTLKINASSIVERVYFLLQKNTDYLRYYKLP